jgi:bifunctional enzyme CysN/CysC
MTNMTTSPRPAPQSIRDFLAQEQKKDLLRFSTAGSVDDGKSTLIGRLLVDSKHIYQDQLESVRGKSKEQPGIDYAWLMDGLKAEREQGITIDVAYRYFSTPKRKFIIADTPGHEQYTRNMATGASTANVAVILIDARRGVLVQSKRHAFITSLLGVPHMIVAVNKMDLVGFGEPVFNKIKEVFSAFISKLNIKDVRYIPLSALYGDNVVKHSRCMPWYTGESLMEMLETIYIGSDRNLIDLRFPVQYVLRPHQDFRGYAGMVESGVVKPGDEVLALPSLKPAKVKAVVTYAGPVSRAMAPLSVAVTLDREIDISRGDMLVHRHNLPKIGHHFEAMLIWMSEHSMNPGGSYLIKQTTQTATVTIDNLHYRVDVNTLKRQKVVALHLNEIGRAVITSAKPLFYDPYEKNQATGSFILIDLITNNTVAAGMIIDREPAEQLPAAMLKAGHSGAKLTRHKGAITGAEKGRRLRQKPATLWLTGLVGSGKTELSYALERNIFEHGGLAVVLDGENIRLGLNRDLDFSPAGRSEHLRRVAEVARILNENGVIAICAFVSPDAKTRAEVRKIIGKEAFVEIYLNAPVEWCRDHDQTGLYKKAVQGSIKNLPGVNVVYDPPRRPDLVVSFHEKGCDAAVVAVVAHLEKKCVLL